mgnify:CR=1 FL=1
MATITRVITLIAGRAYSGLAGSLSYRVEKTDLSSTWIGNTSVGITELGSTGTYAVAISSWDTAWAGRIVWRLSGSDIAQEDFASMDAFIADKTGYSLATTPPTASDIATAILATPANKLATNTSGYVTATNGGGMSASDLAALRTAMAVISATGGLVSGSYQFTQVDGKVVSVTVSTDGASRTVTVA